MKLFFLVLVAFVAMGCKGNCPELVVYREGLHTLDEQLYTQHKQLMSDAVAKGIRTQADSDVVTAEINQAEQHYQTSKKGDNAPATQP